MFGDRVTFAVKRFKFLPQSVVEAGFLIALMFGSLGPVPRYSGWFIAIIGLLIEKNEVSKFVKSLPLLIKVSFAILLVWGAGVTILGAQSLFYWAKGWSLVLEFAFSVLLSAFVLRFPDSFERWRHYMVLVVCFIGGFTLWAFVFNGKTEGLFPLHTFPSTVTIPLFSLTVLAAFDGRGNWRGNILHFTSLFLLVAMFLIGLSSGALVSNTVALVVFLCLFRPSGKALALFFTLAFLVGVCLSVTLPTSKHWSLVQRKIRSEIAQLSSFSDPVKLTSKRNNIWEASFFLAKRHPAGIGWNQFENIVKNYIEKKQLTRKHFFPSIHNEYLTVLVEGGIPSFVAYLLFLGVCISVLHSLARNKERLKSALLGSAFAGILVFALVGGLFDERQILAVYFWTIFGAILSQHDNIIVREEERLL
ncbi:MAG: O-antigen ligase family protein [Dehalococcoidales bacterium]|nr:O-antigen ligase family protein [Dehalococcoidales bacterium]